MGMFEDKKTRGVIFNIQKYSVHDGPGIRTIVFSKGCPLRCRWCSNPESQNSGPELAVNTGRCLGLDKCRHCIEACPRGAIVPSPENRATVDRSKCEGCVFPCAQSCPAQGLLVYGTGQSVDEVLAKVEQDAFFYARSRGGLTISGGEPLFHHDFALALLREAKRRRLRAAVETCGLVPWETLEEASPLLSYVLFDIKHMDSDTHRAQTSRPNERILENFARLAALDDSRVILARTPVVPGFNDSPEAVRDIAEFLKPFGGHVRYELLPYHRLGTQKYVFLDRTPPMGDAQLDPEHFARLQDTAAGILGDRFEKAQ